ncbi:MAG: hypothetical protein Q9167_003288 [Letrouitia subvulpina]
MEPTDQDIESFIAVSDLTREEAIQWLKAYDNDPEKCANAWLDDPGSLQKKVRSAVEFIAGLDMRLLKLVIQLSQTNWDEAQFHSDNAGIAGQQVPFHHPDSLGPDVFNNTAPSRPPSRVSTTADDIRYPYRTGPDKQLTLQEQEDQDFQYAMNLSTSQTQDQETGVTASDQSYFGPVRHEHQETKNWIMTYSKPTAKEVLLNPEPKDRQRSPDTPAFLKPSPIGHRLSALLTILHSIPVSREAFLNREHIKTDYGYHSEWWDGTSIESSWVFDEQDPAATESGDIIYELQRLMAFLSHTERAYGSTEALFNLPSIRCVEGDHLIPHFLQSWKAAATHYDPASPLAHVFTTEGVRTASDESNTPLKQQTCCLDLYINNEIAFTGQTIYDALDDMLWPSPDPTESGEVYLETVADVLVLQVTRQSEAGSGLGIKIPITWYSDRYLQPARKFVKQMLKDKAALKNEITRLDDEKAKLTRFNANGAGGRSFETVNLLDAAKSYFEKRASTLDALETAGGDEPEVTSTGFNGHTMLAEELKELSGRVTERLRDESKTRAMKQLHDLSRLFTVASENPDQPPYHRYTLRGVCAEHHTVFIQIKSESDSEDDDTNTEKADWQWWKLEYHYDVSQAVSRTKVREIEVLKAAKDDARTALLVYASDQAMTWKTESVPSQLLDFVRVDNLSFAAELESSTSPKPMTPTKRKADDQGDDDYDEDFQQYARSPPKDRATESGAEDPVLPWSSGPAPPAGVLAPRATRLNADSYDNYIPTSLRGPEPALSPSSMLLDDEDRLGETSGQEMQDKGAGRGLVQRGSGTGAYKLGSYVPEISMDDEESSDLEVQRP